MSEASEDILILKTFDRKGHLKKNAVPFRRFGQDFVLAAINEQRVKPDWYINLKNESMVEIEVEGTDRFASATTPVGRDRLDIWPLVEELAANTTRTKPRNITGVLLTPMD